LVVDPHDETVSRRLLGSMTAGALDRFLTDARAPAPTAEADLLLGHHALGEAATAYRRALDEMAPGDPRRSRAVDSLLVALEEDGHIEDCVRTFVDEGGRLPIDASLTRLAYLGMICQSSGGEAPWTKELAPAVELLLRRGAAVKDGALEQRSGLYRRIAEIERASGDSAAAKVSIETRVALLEAAWRTAPDARARLADAALLVSAAIDAGEPARAEAPLLRAEREVPDDLAPPLRLAAVYLALGRPGDASAAAARARRNAAGAEARMRVAELQATIATRLGDPATARQRLREIVVALDGQLPPRLQPRMTQIKERLAQMK
jgi:hypothetical protein